MNTASLKWRFPLAVIILAFAFYLCYPPLDPDGSGPKTGKIKLGLDLQGGMHLVLNVKTETLPIEQRHDATERAIEIIRNRIDQFGVSEPVIQRQGEHQIVIQLPGVADRERALALIGKTALLEFKLVSDRPGAEAPGAGEGIEKDGLILLANRDGGKLWVDGRSAIEGKHIMDAQRNFGGQWNENLVSISFDAEGGKKFGDLTGQNVGRRLAIVLDGVILSAPVIQEPIYGGNAQITGSFTAQEAQDLAISLRAGALPAPIEVEEERTVGPSLGRDSIRQGLQTMGYAGLAVIFFMAIYYFASGLIADFAMAANVLLILAALAYFRATLTLPGIAGMILTIGMAVDANVLILERIREELRLGKKAASAIATGYKKAFSAIFDSNLTTLFTAIILFNFGTGPIRGFALTLIIGIVSSFFSGIFLTRLIYEMGLAIRPYDRLHMMSLMKEAPKWPLMKIRKPFFLLSCLIVAGSLFVIGTQANKSLGIDFAGGVVQEFRFASEVKIDALREVIEKSGVKNAVIQETVGGLARTTRDYVVRSPQGTGDAVHAAITREFAAAVPERVRVESVGPVVGQDLRTKAVYAVLASLVMILVYLAFRFELRYSVATIAALFHDAVVCTALVILTGRELSIPVLAAVLTIVGYSANDTIVIFDRVRENVRRGLKMSYQDVVGLSVNETLSRTFLTALTVLIVVVALFLFGGAVLNDFAFTMLCGVIAGTYSTIFVACPLVIDWNWRKKI